MTPQCIAEYESAVGGHYLHSSPETLARLEKARAVILLHAETQLREAAHALTVQADRLAAARRQR